VGGRVSPAASWTTTTVETTLTGPAGLALEHGSDAIIIADESGQGIRRVRRDGRLLGTILGSCGVPGSLPGFLNRPSDVLVSPTTGALYVADTGNHRVLRVENGVASTVIGEGSVSSAGEGSPARQFPVNAPRNLAMDIFGNLYVASTTTLRLIANVDGDDDADGDDSVSTIFGGGDRLRFPESDSFCLNAVAVHEDGKVYAADACQGFLVEVSPLTVSN
jgi:DNA-binding beta-propeller fold protein YncE